MSCVLPGIHLYLNMIPCASKIQISVALCIYVATLPGDPGRCLLSSAVRCKTFSVSKTIKQRKNNSNKETTVPQ